MSCANTTSSVRQKSAAKNAAGCLREVQGPLDEQQRGAGVELQCPRHRIVHRVHAEGLPAEARFQPITLRNQLRERLRRHGRRIVQTGKHVGVEVQPFDDDRLAGNGTETLHRIDLAPGQRILRIGCDIPQSELLQPARLQTDPASPERGESASEGEQVHLGHHTLADECASTASSFQHALAHQHLGCLSNGRTSQAVAGWRAGVPMGCARLADRVRRGSSRTTRRPVAGTEAAVRQD